MLPTSLPIAWSLFPPCCTLGNICGEACTNQRSVLANHQRPDRNCWCRAQGIREKTLKGVQKYVGIVSMYVSKVHWIKVLESTGKPHLTAQGTYAGRWAFSWITSLSGLENKTVASQTPEADCPPSIRPQRLDLFKRFRPAFIVLILSCPPYEYSLVLFCCVWHNVCLTTWPFHSYLEASGCFSVGQNFAL